jgi:DNA-binding NarL/FixJ family response regulator
MVDPTVDVVDDKRVIRVFILDDHELVRRGLTDLLDSADDMEVVGQAANAGEALLRFPAARPDVALLDARLPDGSGIEVCRDIRSSHPEVSCVILTSFDDEEALFAAVMAGASGYLLKQIRGSSLIDGIRQVAAGRSLVDPAVTRKLLERIRHPVEPDPVANSLTAREREILSLIADGYTNRQIGERIFLAEKTVKNYVSALLAKLGMQRRTQAAVYGASLKRPTDQGWEDFVGEENPPFVLPLWTGRPWPDERRTATVESAQLVVLRSGDRISADLTLTVSHALAVDESMISGESVAVQHAAGELAIAGTFVV